VCRRPTPNPGICASEVAEAVAANNQNQLFFGDNLDVLRQHVPDESVDLVYLDPQPARRRRSVP